MDETEKLDKLLFHLICTVFGASVFTVTLTHHLNRLPHVDRHANSSPTSGVQNSLEKQSPRTELSMVYSMLIIRLARLPADLVHIKTMILQ